MFAGCFLSSLNTALLLLCSARLNLISSLIISSLARLRPLHVKIQRVNASHVIAGALIFTNKVFIHVHTSKLLKNLLRYNKKWLFHEPFYAVKKRPKYVNGSHIDVNIQQDVYLRTLIFIYEHGRFLAEPGKEIEITTNKLNMRCLKY